MMQKIVFYLFENPVILSPILQIEDNMNKLRNNILYWQK